MPPEPQTLLTVAILAVCIGILAARGPRVAGTSATIILIAASLVAFAIGRQLALPILLVLMLFALEYRRRRGGRIIEPRWQPALTELTLISLAYLSYNLARRVAESSYREAHGNAMDVISFEKSLHIFVEPTVQGWALRSETALHMLTTIYGHLFFPVVVAALLWLFLTNTSAYVLLRNCLGISVLLAIVLIALYPVAPPRLVPQADVIDVAASLGREHTFSNEYAAIPSLHAGWMALVGFALGRASNIRFARALGFLPAIVMGFTVVATGNHYVTDIAIGIGLSLVPALIFASWERDAVPGERRPPAYDRGT